MAEAAYAPELSLGSLSNEIGELGLQRHIEDLDAHGYTVIPPEIASPNGLAERMLEACLDIAERRSGERPDLERGRPKSRIDSPVGDTMKALLLEDPVFEESLMNPVMLALATHLCGYDVVLSSLISSMKGLSKTPFRLHTDTRLPSPLPTQALLCKRMVLLTDFNRDNGSTVFAPGSHKWLPQPGRRRNLDWRRRQRPGCPRRSGGGLAACLSRQYLARRVQSRGAGAASCRASSHGAVPPPRDGGLHRQDPAGGA